MTTSSPGNSFSNAIRVCAGSLLLFGGAFCACDSAFGQSRTHRYTVAIDAALHEMQVDVRFAGPVHDIAARSRRAGRYTSNFRQCDGARLPLRGRRLLLPAGGTTCLRYRVDLQNAARAQRRNRGLADGNLVLSPSIWLWRPRLDAATRLNVEFVLPPGVLVSAPWQELDASGRRFVVMQSPESADAAITLGDFVMRRIEIPGATLRVSLMRGRQPADSEGLLRWIEAAATDVSLAYGSFPNPSPQVIVIPTANRGRRGSAVPYGRVVRNGGEAVELFINSSRPLATFLQDWTATHEFSHLLLPYLERRSRWISEGFAQYYQNVLLARSGAYDEQRAWQKLYEGLERGRRSRPDLSPNAAAAYRASGSTMKVYWSGAALALLADVRLRAASNGSQTLDTVLQRLQACCLPSQRSWSGTQLLTKLDELAGRDVFMPLYRRHADAAGFPDTTRLFARLGLTVDGGRVRLEQRAELSDLRDAITALDSATARWRRQLAVAGSQPRAALSSSAASVVAKPAASGFAP